MFSYIFRFIFTLVVYLIYLVKVWGSCASEYFDWKLYCPKIFSSVPNFLEGRSPRVPKLKFLAWTLPLKYQKAGLRNNKIASICLRNRLHALKEKEKHITKQSPLASRAVIEHHDINVQVSPIITRWSGCTNPDRDIGEARSKFGADWSDFINVDICMGHTYIHVWRDLWMKTMIFHVLFI